MAPQPRYGPPHMRPQTRNNEWRTWQELKIKIQGLPKSVRTLDVYRLLKDEGEITRIDIDSQAVGTAWVTFSPPPCKAFWSEQLKFPSSERLLAMEARQQQQALKSSPVNPDTKYPETMVVSAESIDFGFMYSESQMMTMQQAAPDQGCSINFSLDLGRAEIRVQFPLVIFDEKHGTSVIVPYRFQVPLQRVKEVYEEQHDTKRFLVLSVDGIPHYFRKVRDVESTHGKDRIWSDWKLWYRQTDITHLRSSLKTAPTTLHKKNAVIDIARWTTYRLEFDHSEATMTKYHQICDALTDWNVNVITDSHITLLQMKPAILWDIIDAPLSSPCSSVSPRGLLNNPIKLEFEVRYQLEVCLSNNILNEHNVTREFVERLAQMDKNMAKSVLEAAMDKKRRFFEPMDIFKLPLRKEAMLKQTPAHCVYSRSANITPSTITFASPTMEISNRIIREYLRFSDRFLRVKFTEEKPRGKIRSSRDDKDTELFTRVWRTLRNGIAIGDRHYEFLAFGNSQFREHGAYFFAPIEDDLCDENNITPSDIRMLMGDFDEIREVARYASRMGQCFSTTREATSVKAHVSGHEDIMRNGYIFTDGVGKISATLAVKIAQEFGHPTAVEDPPSVFQFRLGGCKGVLAVSKELGADEIHIRRSQDKFPAPSEGLEIIKWSQFATATLNRQLIIILDARGVPNGVFMKKLQDQLSDLKKAMTSEVVALRLLQRFVDSNQVSLTLAGMVLDGFMGIKEPFLMSVLHLWRTWSIKYLKEKARLFVGEGAFLLGCLDETASLHGHFYSEQNWKSLQTNLLPQIFVQVSDINHPGRYKIIEGVCIVARNPSLHPGDVRVVQAVNQPKLHHLKNVVVFPQTGDRDIPNMCSGGDLDGDDYMVVWDKELIPQKNYKPMDFTPPQKQTVQKVTMEHITKFFVEYIKNDSLGVIANAHLAAADFEDEGVMSKRCNIGLELARIHSTAVDYPKSGVAAIMDKGLAPRRYPHFMQNDFRNLENGRCYESKKILGQLFDAVKEVDFDPQYDAPFDSRILNAYNLEPATLARAGALKVLYDAAVRRLMAQHDIQTEFEVWSTFILKHNNEIRDYSLQEDFGRIWDGLRERFQKLCFEEAAGGFREGLYGTDDKEKRAALQETGRAFINLGPFVAAMYTVTAQEMQAAIERTGRNRAVAGHTVPVQKMSPDIMPLMSFPWIFSRELGLIANGIRGRPEGLALHSQVQRKQPIAKNAGLASAVKGAWSKEDELFVDGGRVKHGEFLDIFHDSNKSKEQHQAPEGSLRDFSNIPTEPTIPARPEAPLDKGTKGLERRQLSSKKTQPDGIAHQGGNEMENYESVYSDGGPYPAES
ncbi:RNA dependent RNA polymerase-domain-containing protein [Macrophomina phaseolina]|uniref:RNA-dependent RNA polymerase n=1 Tax=Macrophomina phaseolina TaxID=35725 RepID=A0ABQ8GJ64_9PEZI|nr:RNA dependent RNA polymerase-domain-containing protein [Macrophomina phaseolina]